jgi:predicted Rossmann fold flavoprotein
VSHDADIVIVGAGAAGLAAAIFAGEAATGSGWRIVALERARKPGAKILVSGGGRCNVTNERVRPEDFCGGPRPLIRSVLRAFDERRTLDWMASLGVPLKLEPTGKYFPVSDSAKTVVEALLRRVAEVGVDLRTGTRVAGLSPGNAGFSVLVDGSARALHTRRVIFATGWLRALGHTILPTTPALAPLVLRPGPEPGGRFAEWAGITCDIRLDLRLPTGRVVASTQGSAVFTHFGISGPAPMDFSRHLARFRLENPGAAHRVTLGHPRFPDKISADRYLLERTAVERTAPAARVVAALYPERIARALAPAGLRLCDLTREQRERLALSLAAMPLEVVGDRGYAFAETTAGGVDLREVDIRTMESRVVRGLHLCGEILDADGRIGGFNFQWAWATGWLAGRGAVAGCQADASTA